MGADVKRTALTVRLGTDVHERLRVTCELLGLSVQEVAAGLLCGWVEDRAADARARADAVLGGR